MNKPYLVIVIICFLFLVGVASAATPSAVKVQKTKDDDRQPPLPKQFQDAQEQQKPFWDDEKHGWYWYEKDPEKKPDDPKNARKYVPALKDYTTDELWTMHPDDFQALITSIEKKAVQYPTEENVHDFYTMVDITRRRAQSFVSVAEVVWMKNPELILGRDYPTNVLGDNTKTRIRSLEIEQKITRSSDNFGLVYFYSDTCEFCQAQGGILKYFFERYPWSVKKVEISRDPEFAQRFNVETVPFILLVSRETGNSLPVAVGVVALDELEKNVYRGIRLLSGETKPEEFNMYEYERGGAFDPNARR